MCHLVFRGELVGGNMSSCIYNAMESESESIRVLIKKIYNFTECHDQVTA